MHNISRNPLAMIALFLSITISVSVASALDEFHSYDESEYLDSLLIKNLEDYEAWYPEILFLPLKGGDHTIANMVTLGKVLGKNPRSLDYEHPPELREDLIDVSVNRILLMLQSRMPSSSLFKAGDEAAGRQEYVCVLAIHPHEIAADSLRATQHLLDQPREFVQQIPEDLQLGNEDYLAFVIDHEIYHCLQSMYLGPQKMSHKELWGEYNQFHNELGADAYALGMNIRRKGKVTSFVNNVRLIRGASLISADMNHLTCKAIEHLIKVPAEEIAEMNSREVFAMANKIKKEIAIDYGAYTQYVTSAIQAMHELGVGSLVLEEFRSRTGGLLADPVQVKELVTNAKYCLGKLKGDDVKQ